MKIIGGGFVFGQAAAETTIGLGLTSWEDTSNNDELESGSEKGFYVFGSADYRINRWSSFGFEGSGGIEPLHGINRRCCGNKSADGWYLISLTLHGTGIIGEEDGFYILTGGGITMLGILEDSSREATLTPSVQLGVGYRWEYVDLRFGYLWAAPTQLYGANAKYDPFRVSIGARF